MTQNLKTGLFLLLIIAGVVFAGCTGNSGTTITPVSPSVTATPGNGSDLTNQDSPQAATFRNGASFTPLALPQIPIGLERFAGGFSSPMMIALPHDGSGRMAVADQIGVVKMIVPDRMVSDKPFLDLRDRMVKLNSNYDERGLFSIAFHPITGTTGGCLCIILHHCSRGLHRAGVLPTAFLNSMSMRAILMRLT